MTNKSVSDLSNSELVALAVFDLGGDVKAIDLEDIALKVYSMAPKKFSWRKYLDRIDLRIVQYSLKSAIDSRFGAPFVSGSIKHGYMLTSVGLDWVKSYNRVFDQSDNSSYRSKSTSEKIFLERSRLLSSSAYIKFIEDQLDGITDIDFQDFSRVNEYFPSHARKRRYVLIDNAVKGDPTLESCWSFLKSKFIENGVPNA